MTNFSYPVGGADTVAIAASPSQPIRAMATKATALADVYNGGHYRIDGPVTWAGTPDFPVACKVRLHRKIDGQLVREVFSDVNGLYVFNGIAAQPYYVVAFDHTGSRNAVIKDGIVPTDMARIE